MKRRNAIWMAVIVLTGAIAAWVKREGIIVEAAVMSRSVRAKVFAKAGNERIADGVLARASRIDGEPGYEMMAECYLYLASQYEAGGSLPLDGKSLNSFERAFAGYQTMNWGAGDYEAEVARFKGIMAAAKKRMEERGKEGAGGG